LAKAVIAPFKPTQTAIPQQTEKSKNKVTCKGEYKLDENGRMVYCSKGFYNYETSFSEKERRMSIKERIIQFFDKLIGWSFWIVVGLVIFAPGLLGFVFGRIIEGVFGIGTKAFKQVSTAIQKVKDTNPALIDALEKSTDTDVRAWIDDFKKKNGIK